MATVCGRSGHYQATSRRQELEHETCGSQSRLQYWKPSGSKDQLLEFVQFLKCTLEKHNFIRVDECHFLDVVTYCAQVESLTIENEDNRWRCCRECKPRTVSFIT